MSINDGAMLEYASADFGRGYSFNGPAIWTIPELADGELTNAESMVGAVAIIKRGGCSFVEKARRAMAAGAIAVVIVNTDDGLMEPGDPNNEGRDISIPVVLVAASSGEEIDNGVEVKRIGE